MLHRINFLSINFILIFCLGIYLPIYAQDSPWVRKSGLPQEYNLYDVHAFGENAAIVVGDSGIVIKTTDGGDSWVEQETGVTNILRSVYFTDSITGWAVGYSGTIIHTKDGGDSWVEQESGVPNNLRSVYLTDSITGWVVGRDGTILHTTDGGDNWGEQVSGVTKSLNSVYFTDSITGWVVGGIDGTILHTTDGGDSWVEQESGVAGFFSSYLESVYFIDSSTGWAVAGNGTIIHTTDGGNNWVKQESGVDRYLSSIYFTDSITGWVVGSDGTILHTTDGGDNWLEQESDATEYLRSVYFTDSYGWAVGLDGVILNYWAFWLHVTVDIQGEGTVTGDGFFASGDEVVLHAMPSEGYEFINWTDDKGVVSEEPEYTFSMPNEDITLTANFAAIEYTLSLNIEPEGAGLGIGDGIYNIGDEVTLQAPANEGYVFVNWTDAENDTISTAPRFIYTMPADNVILTANFVESETHQAFFTVEGETGEENPIEGTIIMIEGEVFLETEQDGTAGIHLPPGSYVAVLSKTGFFQKEIAFTIDNSDKSINVVLEPSISFVNGWRLEHVMEGKEEELGAPTSIAIDPDNHPHIGFWRYGENNLFLYKNWDGNQWITQHCKADSEGWIKIPSSSNSFLALDSQGRPHFIVEQQYNSLSVGQSYPTFLYYWYNGVNWQRKVLYTSQMAWGGLLDDMIFIYGSSLALDENDQPHIGVCLSNFRDVSEIWNRFYYNYLESGNWHEEIIERRTHENISLAIDKPGVPHISYSDELYDEINYTQKKEDTWEFHTLDNEGYGPYNSIKTDSVNNPHISYYDTENNALKYALWDGSNWHLETVDNSGSVGKYTSLALDSNDYPHISYYDATHGALKYARWDGIEWIIETIDDYPEGNVGLYTSIALDPDDKVHISYYDNYLGDIKYATNRIEAETFTIALEVTPEGSGEVSGEGEYEREEQVTLTATPETGYHFVNWTEDGDEVSISEEYVFTAEEERSLIANFEINTYSILANSNDETFGAVSGDGEYDHFEEVTLTATSETGYHFVNWTEDGEEVSTGEEYVFTAEQERNLVANFEINTYSILAVSNDETFGTVAGGGEYNHFEEVTLAATPANGYHFVNWTEEGKEISINEEFAFTAEQERNLVANFEINTYTITVQTAENGSITPSGEVEVEYGNAQVFSISPNESFKITYIRIDGNEINLETNENWDAESGQYTFSNVTEAHTIEVGFEDATGMREAADQNELKVYPNPAKNELWIEFNYRGSDNPVIVLQNLRGQTLKQIPVNETGSLLRRMTTHNLASGIYLLTIRGEEVFPVKMVMIEK